MQRKAYDCDICGKRDALDCQHFEFDIPGHEAIERFDVCGKCIGLLVRPLMNTITDLCIDLDRHSAQSKVNAIKVAQQHYLDERRTKQKE